MEKMINEYVVALDAGKYETKLIGRNINGDVNNIKRINFRTKYYDLAKGYIDVAGNSHKVKFNDIEYILGEQGTEDATTETSKMTLLHQLSAYVAITQILDNTKNNKVKLVLACPLTTLRKAEAKEDFKSFIKGDGIIKIEVNDIEYEFEIIDVTIKAEGSGIFILENEQFINKNVGVIDFGGLNMGFTVYRNSVVNPNERFIDDLGVRELTFRVVDGLTDLYNNTIKYEQAEIALENGYMTNLSEIDVKSIEVINKAKEDFFKDAIILIQKRGFKLEQLDTIIFVGGTTQKLRDQILNKYKKAIIPSNSQWTNVEGFYKIAVAKYCR